MIVMTTNATELGRTNHWRRNRLLVTLHESNKANARILKRGAQEITSLTCHSLADLRRMGHPYATRAPNPPHEVHLIHSHRGAFLRGWYSRTTRHGDDFVINFGNQQTELLMWLETGTVKMIRRGPMTWIVKEKTPELQLNNRRAYRSALGLHGAAARSRARKYVSGLG